MLACVGFGLVWLGYVGLGWVRLGRVWFVWIWLCFVRFGWFCWFCLGWVGSRSGQGHGQFTVNSRSFHSQVTVMSGQVTVSSRSR